nr:ribonuclease H-like domain-containing protein [Tanacetum cinerariifolium]
MAGDNENATNPPPVPPTPQAPHTISTIKLPILKKGVDTLSFDDLYNNLRVFESDVKGSTASSSNTQNMTFVSSNNTNSTNEVSTAYGVSTSSSHNSQKEGSSSYINDLIDRFEMAGGHDFHKIVEVLKKGKEKAAFDAKEPVGFDKTKVKCFNCPNIEHFARECRSKGNQESRRRYARSTRYKGRDNGRRHVKQDEHKAMVTIDGEGVDWTGHADDDIKNYALMAFNSSNSGSDTKVTSCSKVCEESYAKLKKLYDEQREQLGVASIEIQAYTLALKKMSQSLQMVQNKTSESDVKTNNLDFCESNSSVEALESVHKPVESKPKAVSEPKVWSDALIIKGYESDSKLSKTKTHVVRILKFPKETRLVECLKDWVLDMVTLERHALWPFNRTTAPKANFANHKVNTAGDKTITAVRGNRETAVKTSADNPHKTLKEKGIVDSGCSRHMTRNKAHLVEYQDFNGGHVAFGGSKGQITEYQDFNGGHVAFGGSKGQITGKENIVPSGGLACLIAKATVDEYNKLYRRDQGEYSNARTPKQNRVAEKKNRTLIEAARTMPEDSFLPNTFWAEAFSTACYVLNRPVTVENKANITAGPKEANNST